MTSSWITDLGNWNPQLLREFRGRLRPRTVIAAIAISVIVQALILLVFFESNAPVSASEWRELWRAMTWVIPYALFTLGSYYLVSDLTQEEKRGTLNFIRLSPRPAWQILLGKLLGVPVLPLLALVLFIPLYCITAIAAGVPILFLSSFFIVVAVECLFCWSLAMLFGLLGSNRTGIAGQASTLSILFAFFSLMFLSPFFMGWNTGVLWQNFESLDRGLNAPFFQTYWAYFPINQNSLISHLFTLTNLGIGLFINWRMLLRRFRRPRATIFSKRQSYGIMAYGLILVVGFCLRPEAPANTYASGLDDPEFARGFVYVFTQALSLILMSGICPQRQALLEWSRTRQEGLLGFVWGEKSPAVLSFVVLIIISNAILIPWAILTRSAETSLGSLAIVFAGLSTTWVMYGVFIQGVLASKLRSPGVWVLGTLILWWIVPPIVLSTLQLTHDDTVIANTLWTFFGYPVLSPSNPTALGLSAVGILGQWGLLAYLLFRLYQTLTHIKRLQSYSNPK